MSSTVSQFTDSRNKGHHLFCYLVSIAKHQDPPAQCNYPTPPVWNICTWRDRQWHSAVLHQTRSFWLLHWICRPDIDGSIDAIWVRDAIYYKIEDFYRVSRLLPVNSSTEPVVEVGSFRYTDDFDCAESVVPLESGMTKRKLLLTVLSSNYNFKLLLGLACYHLSDHWFAC